MNMKCKLSLWSLDIMLILDKCSLTYPKEIWQRWRPSSKMSTCITILPWLLPPRHFPEVPMCSIMHAALCYLIVIFSHVLRKKLQITPNNRICECPRWWWQTPLALTSDLSCKVTWATSAFFNDPALPHHPTHPNISRKSTAAKKKGPSSALPLSS